MTYRGSGIQLINFLCQICNMMFWFFKVSFHVDCCMICSSPQASDKQPWLQISFSDMEREITKITTWGGGKGLGYVKVYRLAFTLVGDKAWTDYTEGDRTRVSIMFHN